MNLVATAAFLAAIFEAVYSHEGHSELEVPQTQLKCTDQSWVFNGTEEVPAGLTVDYNSAFALLCTSEGRSIEFSFEQGAWGHAYKRGPIISLRHG
jgi:hypothetical protein